MPSDRDIALVKAALEAAAAKIAGTRPSLYGLAAQVRFLDPAVIAATVHDPMAPRLDVAYLLGENKRLADELSTLRMEINNFPNLTAIRECMVAAADEAVELNKRISELEHALNAVQAYVEMLERKLAEARVEMKP